MPQRIKTSQGFSPISGPAGPPGAAAIDLAQSGIGSYPPPSPAVMPFLLFQSGHAAWGGAGTYNLNDTTDYCIGTQSARMTTSGAGDNTRIAHTELPPHDFTDRDVLVWIKVHDWTHLDVLSLWLSSDEWDFNNAFVFDLTTFASVNALRYLTPGTWVPFVVPWSHGVPQGMPDRSAIQTVQLQAFDNNTANQVVIGWNGLASVSRSHNPFPKGVVSLTFDDGYATQYDVARPRMDLKGMRGTLYVISNYIEDSNPYYLTEAQMRALQNVSGWEIAAHAHDDAMHDADEGYATGFTFEQVMTDLRTNQDWLVQRGMRGGAHFAYPKGHFDGPVLAVAQANTVSGRALINTPVETWPPADPHRLRAYLITTGTPVSAVTALIDQAVADRAWLILCFHQLEDPKPNMGMTPTDFQAVIDHLDASGADVLPVGEVLQGGGARTAHVTSVTYSSGTGPPRPNYAVVIWIGPNQPANWIDGDIWLQR